MNQFKMKKSGIYYIKNNINNKCYIGSSVNIIKRLSHHKNRLNNNLHCNPHLQKSWNKYGKENFSFGIIEETNNLFELEEKYIRELGYYNINEIRMEKQVLNKTTKDNISKTLLGKSKSNLHKNNISKAKCIKIYQYDLEGNFIKEFNSSKEASELLKIQRSDISSCIKGRKKSAGNYIWKNIFRDKIEPYKRKRPYKMGRIVKKV